MSKKSVSKPIVIASGGPSLAKQLQLLKETRESVLLIAAGSTINSLLKQNIYPDYVVSIDGTEINREHYSQLKLAKTKLVYCFTNHHEIRNEFSGSGYLFLLESEKQLNRIIKNELNMSVEFPILKGGGTVAHFSLSFARYISDGPIALIGQDLAFTNNKSHEENNKGYKEINLEKLPENYSFVEDYYGGKVLTNSLFLGMKQDFEKLVELLPNPKSIYNCTEGGVLISDMCNIPFKTYLEKFSSNTLKEDLNLVEKSYKVSKDLLNIYFTNLINQCETILEDLVLLQTNRFEENTNPQGQLIRSVTDKISSFKSKYPFFITEDKLSFLKARIEVERSESVTDSFNFDINKELIIIFETFKDAAGKIVNKIQLEF